MSINYFKCFECKKIFVGGNKTIPENLICLFGRCDIREIDKEEALDSVEEENE